MASFCSSESQAKFTGLVVPTYITFQAATAIKSVYLSAYCNTPERVVHIIQRTVQQLGGASVCQSIESDGLSRQLLIGAQLPDLSSSNLWKVRTAIQKAGGIVETVRINYQIHQPVSGSSQRPKACIGCRYYYGSSHSNVQLVCAMHPYGPSNNICQDWVALAI